MKTPREILFRAKRIDNGGWVEGYYCTKKPYCFDNRTEPNHIIITEFSVTGTVYYEIDPTTLSQFTGWKDSHGNRIFENDIVEIVSSPRTSYKYLIWWNREMSMMEAISFDGINFNGTDYWNDKEHRDYETFCLMLQDPWGDFSEIKVIGNLFDNYEIIKENLKNDTVIDKLCEPTGYIVTAEELAEIL